MNSKKKLLRESRLYLIVDKKTAGRKKLREIAKKAEKAGIDIIQLRDKYSKKHGLLREAFILGSTLRNTKTLFIVNDHLDVAKITDADGLHLGQSDCSIKVARGILGKDKLIGISCHNLKQALEAQKAGADYIGLGPVFPTPTKKEYRPIGLGLIRKVKQKIRIPFFVIGDINLKNIHSALSFGAQRVAVCRAILRKKNISSAASDFKKILCP